VKLRLQTAAKKCQRRGKSYEATVRSKPSKQIDIFKDWIRSKTACLFVDGPAYEDPGVPVAQSDPAEPAVQPVEKSSARSRALKVQREIRLLLPGSRARQNPDWCLGSGFEFRVKEPDRIACRSARTRMHLYTAASGTSEHLHSRASSGAEGVIRAATVNAR